jgi:hypothetical protein
MGQTRIEQNSLVSRDKSCETYVNGVLEDEEKNYWPHGWDRLREIDGF